METLRRVFSPAFPRHWLCERIFSAGESFQTKETEKFSTEENESFSLEENLSWGRGCKCYRLVNRLFINNMLELILKLQANVKFRTFVTETNAMTTKPSRQWLKQIVRLVATAIRLKMHVREVVGGLNAFECRKLNSDGIWNYIPNPLVFFHSKMKLSWLQAFPFLLNHDPIFEDLQI